LTKKKLGFTLGDFFTKSSGHPGFIGGWVTLQYRDLSYDFKNIFAEKISEKVALSTHNPGEFCKIGS
jgi:hypothetical protein